MFKRKQTPEQITQKFRKTIDAELAFHRAESDRFSRIATDAIDRMTHHNRAVQALETVTMTTIDLTLDAPLLIAEIEAS